MEETALIQQYLQGDEKAFETLVTRYLQPIYNFVFHFVYDEHQAQDLTQEIFLKVWGNLKNYNPEKSFKAWLFTIAKNTCFDFLKKKKITTFSQLENEEKNFEVEDLAPLPPEIFHQAQQAKNLEAALKKLSPLSRNILLLYYKNDLNFREISEVLDESLNTVKSRHRRALILLKEILSEQNTA